MKLAQKKTHYCGMKSPYSQVIEDCREDNYGKLWICNGQRMAPVNYCPKCGYKAKVSYNYKD